MAAITSSGSVSGLNVTDLVSQLVAAERAPYDARNLKVDTKLTTEFTALSKLKGAMATFQGALTAMKDAAGFTQRKASVSDADALAATASGNAAAGVYEIEVQKLAKAAQLASSPFLTGSTAVIGTGTLTLAMGAKSFSVEIADPKKTLADVRDAINSAKDNVGVRATLIKAADGTRLVLTGSATGAANAVKITTTGGDGGLNQLVYDPPGTTNLEVLDPAQDAEVFIAGHKVLSPDNVVDDSIDGVSLTLKQEEVGKVMNLTIAPDDSAVQAKVQSFVTAYNALASTITGLRSYNAETKVAGPLLGDAMLRGIESQMRRAISDPVTGGTSRYTTLASLGISTTAAGVLALDAPKYAAAIAADPTAAAQLFGAAGGIATRLDKLMTDHLATGADLSARDAGITARRKTLDAQKTAVDARMVIIQARYTKQFNQLDSLLTTMQSTSAYLAKSLATTS